MNLVVNKQNIKSSSKYNKVYALDGKWGLGKKAEITGFISKSNSLTFKAKLPDNQYLKIINSFLINLDKSELVKFNDIDLVAIKQLNKNSSIAEYSFEINTKVSTNYNEINEKYLTKLGSFGLFNRINILKNIDTSLD